MYSGTKRPTADALPLECRGRPGHRPPTGMKACLFAGNRLVLPDGAHSLPDLNEARGWNAGEAEWFPAIASRPAAWDSVHAAEGDGVHAAEGRDARAIAAPGERAETADDTPVVAARVAPGWTPPGGVSAIGLRQAIVLLQEPDLSIALTAAHLARWRHTSRFCGVCGTATEPSRRHQAMVCRSCGHLTFPKVSPAVIVQVTRGNRILLGRSRRHPHGGYSVLAGFVDPGERLEDTVRREVEEESGIRVRNVRYFDSQPWPLPDSLMVGFTAEYDGGEIHSGDAELEDVAWFRADALPPVPPAYSIARALIDDFARRNGVDPARIPTWQRR